jgi:hypothetical protein
MLEKDFWSDKLRPRLTAACQEMGFRFHFERIENGVADGTPDVDYCIAGSAGQIELKFADRHPTYTSSQVLGRGKGLRRSQIVYAARRTWAGGVVWCLTGTPEASWLIDLRTLDAERMDGLCRWSVQDFEQEAVWRGHLEGYPALVHALLAVRR